MPERVQKQKPAPQEKVAEQEDVKVPEQPDLSEIDALLDEIDGILEENAEQFVKDYVQKGGQ